MAKGVRHQFVPQTPGGAPVQAGVRGTWLRGWAAFNELLVHTLLILFVLCCIELIHLFIGYLRHGEEMIFLKGTGLFEFRARWLFDVADAVMIGALLTVGVRATYIVYRGAESDHV